MISTVPVYHLHDTAGDDLGLLEHPATNVEPGDVVHLSDGREALVTARVETNDEAIWALLEVLVAPSSPHIPTWRAGELRAPS
jgi:hypothetical protein